jgi:exonuclease SbcC
MRFERLALRNFKCFADADVDLNTGVTVVHGINGSGKSSLLEACFFALYGATAIDRTLDEIVTIGTEEAEVDLWFTHDGASYHLYRRIRATGDRAATAECTLDGPESTLTGVGDVEGQIRSMLRMDAEAFVNSAFVRQGEINKLIEASPADRKRMIDRLLQLGKLETYRERAREARLGVETIKDRREGRLESLEEQIEAKDESELYTRKSTLETEIADLEETIEELESGRTEARETLSEAESTLETYEKRQEELETVTERIADLRDRIATADGRRENLADSIADLRETIETEAAAVAETAADMGIEEPDQETLEGAIESARERKEALTEEIMELRETVKSAEHEAETASERAEELAERATERRDRAEELTDEIATIQTTIESEKETLKVTGEEIASHRAAFEDAPVEFGAAEAHIQDRREVLGDLREAEAELREEVATLKNTIEEAEALKEAGKCPECGQPVDGSPHVESLDEDRARLQELESEVAELGERRAEIESEIEQAEALREAERTVDRLVSEIETHGDRLAEKRATRDSQRERIAELHDEADTLESDATSAEEDAKAATERAEKFRSKIGDRNKELSELTERIEAVESVQEAVLDLEDKRETLERQRETRSDLADRNDERRETLAELRERKRALEKEIDEETVAQARKNRKNAEAYLEAVETNLAEKRAERDERQTDLGGVTNELQALREVESQRESVLETVESLESLHEEVSELESMYGTLRTDLRQRNVERLETLLNESFELVYRNDSYARIELDGAYELTIYQKDGSPLDPDQLSGGERALFNLSLRAAIYRLLVEGIEGTAPMPPLILDEPTVFLDAGHVTQLVSLVGSMRDLGVEQIIVVSHDEELIGAADDLIRVEKDPTTNRSSVESVAPQLPGQAD